MKLGKIFICINILVLSLLMLRNGLELFIKILIIDLTSIGYDIVETEDGSFCGGTAMKRIISQIVCVPGVEEFSVRGLYRTIDLHEDRG